MKKCLIIFSLLCVGCAKPDLVNDVKTSYLMTSGMKIEVPQELTIRPTADDRRIADNDKNDNDLDAPSEYRISVLPQVSKSCTSTLTGTSRTQPISLETGSASWGRMDAWDGLGKEGWEFPRGWEDMPCKKEGTPLPKEVYTLCAEKAGKTVVICINQMTDNPEQAKEIFETFRWTE